MFASDTIEQLISELDFTYDIKSISDDGTDTTITVCKTFHSRPGLLVNDGATDYTILSVDQDTKIIVLSGVASGTLVLQSPIYFHGVPYKVNEQLDRIRLAKDKLPMIYLLEIYKERRIYDKLSSIDRHSSVRLFFLDAANFAEWDTDQHYSMAIVPMDNLMTEFTNLCQNSPLVGEEFEEGTTIAHANFGVYPRPEGTKGSQAHLNSVFDENTSGMELNVTLPLTIIDKCIC